MGSIGLGLIIQVITNVLSDDDLQNPAAQTVGGAVRGIIPGDQIEDQVLAKFFRKVAAALEGRDPSGVDG